MTGKHTKDHSRTFWLGLVTLFWAGFYHFFETFMYRLDHGARTYDVIQLLVICGFLPVLATIASIIALRHGKKEDEFPDASASLTIVAPLTKVRSLADCTSNVL